MYTHHSHPVELQQKLTTWIAVKEKDGSSQNRCKHSVVQHTSGVDTDEVEENSTKKVQENEKSIQPGIYANSVRTTQGTCWRDGDID